MSILIIQNSQVQPNHIPKKNTVGLYACSGVILLARLLTAQPIREQMQGHGLSVIANFDFWPRYRIRAE